MVNKLEASCSKFSSLKVFYPKLFSLLLRYVKARARYTIEKLADEHLMCSQSYIKGLEAQRFYEQRSYTTLFNNSLCE